MPLVFGSNFPLFSEGVVDRKVFGSVLNAAGQPQVGLTVQIEKQFIEGELVLMGEPETDANGRYELTYNPSVSPQIIRVSLPAIPGQGPEVVVSPAWNEQVDFRLGVLPGAGAARFTDVGTRLARVLQPTQTALSDLDATGLARASIVSGVPPREAGLVRDAVSSSDLSELPTALFYALGRSGLSGAVADVVKHAPEDRALALQRAVATGTLSVEDQAAAEEALADLNDLMIESALQAPEVVATPGQALTLAGVTDPGVRSATLEAWLAHTGDAETFWSELSGLTSEEKGDVQFALALDKLTRSNAPLVDALYGEHENLAELTSLDLDDWETLAENHGVPNYFTGVDTAKYAKAMFVAVEDGFPTRMLSARHSWFGPGVALQNFLAGNPTYDLAGKSFRQFILDNPTAIEAAGNAEAQEAVLAEMPVLERLYRITPRGSRFEVLRDLRAAGISSATQIQLMGRSRFTAALQEALGPLVVEVYRRAKALSSVALMLQSVHGSAAAYSGIPVLPVRGSDPLAGTDVPLTWSQLFGGRSSCACRECQSAHGPSAYLADLLFWLWARGVDGTFSGALLERRPDIGALELSCKNSHTALPTIDLIIERLEQMVEPVGTPVSYQTSLDSGELAARAEHVHGPAYLRLAGVGEHTAVYPFEHPYVAPLDQSRTLLQGMGVARGTLLSALHASGGGSSALGVPEIAAEQLGMTRTSWEFLAGEIDASTAERWGFQADLLAAHPSWTQVGVPESVVAPSEPDADGGDLAVELEDESGGAATAWQVAQTRYRGGSISGTVYVKKDAGATTFAQIVVGIDGSYANPDLAFYFDQTDGSLGGGDFSSLTATEVTGWWRISFTHPGTEGAAESIGLRVLPAAGTSFPTPASATGAVVVYNPRLASTRGLAALANVPVFLQQAAHRGAENPLTYAELEDLLRSRYVQDAGELGIWFDNLTCDIAGADLVSAPGLAIHLDRLSKLLRLSRDIGWTVRDTDRAIEIFRSSEGAVLLETDISEDLLLALGSLRWLEGTLRVTPSALLDWFGPLDTRRWAERLTDGTPTGVTGDGRGRIPLLASANAGGAEAEPSPFQQMARLHGASALFAVSNSGAELVNATFALTAHLDAVAALVGASRVDIAPLVKGLPVTGDPPIRALTLANVSQLYRQVGLARALGLPVAELLVWQERLGVADPFASPGAVVDFVGEVRRQASVRISTDVLDVLLAPRGTRALAELALPTVGEAVLALSDDVRAHRGERSTGIFDVTQLDEHNLLPAAAELEWTPTNATVTTALADPFGGATAVEILDESDTEVGVAVTSEVASYVALTPVWVSLWVRKEPDATHFAELGVRFGATVVVRVAFDPRTGHVAVQDGSADSLHVEDAGLWWMVSFRHAGSDLGPARLVISPAAGTVGASPEFPGGVLAEGALVFYGARLAAAVVAAADPRYADGARLDPASPRYANAARDRAIVRRVGSLLDLDASLASRLLRLATYAFPAATPPQETPAPVPLFDALVDQAETAADARGARASATAAPGAVASLVDPDVWELAAIAGWLCRALSFTADDLPWLFTASSELRGFDIETIVLGATLTQRYSAWAGVREAARLQPVARSGRLLAVLGTLTSDPPATPAALRATLANLTLWEEEDIAAAILDSPAYGGPLGGDSAASWASRDRFGRLARWMELARTLRVPASRLFGTDGWANLVWPEAPSTSEPVSAYTTHADELEAAVRSNWGPERWLAEMPTIRERLRERQRTALVSHVIGSNPWSFATTAALGEHLLMDVHTAGCGRTSRVKDAVRSVQVFVQRVLLGAEGELSLTEEESREWVWRKSYRLWEANRKVFLYPENWLRPELRRDKTPIFEAFEGEIASGDLSTNVVEAAYREYLRKLTEVAKLDVLSVHRSTEDGSEVHRVFGRTRGIPQMYFHREHREGRWTPWREIPKSEGEHLIPVVHHRRLLLFWLSVGESSFAANAVPVPLLGDEVVPPGKYFNIRLSWSEYRDDRWSAPTKGEAAIGVDERGELRPRPRPVETATVSMAANFMSSDATSRFNPRVVHVRVDASGRDILLYVYRQHPDGSSALLGRFRLGGVDGHLLVESAADDTPHAQPPHAAHLFPFETAAQRFFSWTDTTNDVNPLGLSVPLPHATATGASYASILSHETHVPGEWIQVSPLDRVRFDATDPFVFEDAHGSYWATYKPGRFFRGIGFGGSYRPGDDLDLRLQPPVAAASEVATIRFVEGTRSAFRSQHTAGTDALIDSRALEQARGTGKKIVAINGSTADMGARTYALSSTFAVSDGAETIFGARAGVKFGADDRMGIALTYALPTFNATPTLTTEGFHMLGPVRAMWRFETFFHPHVAVMRETLNRLGVFGLLQPPPVTAGDPEPMEGQDPQPESTLGSRYILRRVHNDPPDDLDFSATGAYGQYNWELFFHAPFLIASRLHEAGRFEDAIKWLRTIFDPHRAAQAGASGDLAGQSPWRFRPFREIFQIDEGLPRNIQELVALLTSPSDDDAAAPGNELLQQIRDWRRNPFDPHAIARTRIVTYMTSVVMKYLEVLIDWGDQLFAQDTLESIGEATEYYLLAARILGPPPELVAGGAPEAQTFSQLLAEFQGGVSPTSALEEVIALDAWSDAELDAFGDDATSLATLLYFCVPANPQLRSRFWDRVADRLFKVRNCLNLQGQRRELALFEPPIDPDLLVRAAASGVDLRSVMADIVTGRVPHRRYLAMADLAAGLAASANALGQALLGAIEKRDADQLNTLRAEHERRLHDDTIKARRDQIADLEHQLAAARHAREGTVRRLEFYKSRRRNPKETMALSKSRNAKALSDVASALSAAGAIFNLIPELDVGVAGAGGTPMSKVGFGGKALGAFARASAQAIDAGAQILDRDGRMLLTEAGYERRQEDWTLQADLAQKDLDALDERLISTEIQLAMAQNALASAELRMQQIEEVQDFLDRRFAREDLFAWLADQLSTLHYQSYQLAYEFSKKAETAWRYELGRTDSFIQFGYWDSRRRGLLAADRLAHDLRRMQVAYTELSSRRLEVDQTFSLRDIDPLALLQLQRLGSAEFSLPEAFFDLSYPGHYSRRIRAVRFTIPAVVPPNTNLPAHVELRRHWIRKTDSLDPAALIEGGYGNAPVAMTATSTGQRDGGVFELDFKGPRLLPFEGAGAVSGWRLSLPSAVRTFRYNDIQDVLVHVAYDAEYSGTLRTALEGTPPLAFSNLFAGEPLHLPRRRLISLRKEHGSALRRFVSAAAANTANFSVSFEIAASALPAYIADALRAQTITMTDAQIVLVGTPAELELTLNTATVDAWATWPAGWPEIAGLAAADVGAAFLAGSPPGHGFFGTHTLTVTEWGSFSPADDFDILLVLEFAEPSS